MTGANINDGDMILIREQNVANNGDIVDAAIGDEFVLKTLRTLGEDILLIPENSEYGVSYH